MAINPPFGEAKNKKKEKETCTCSEYYGMHLGMCGQVPDCNSIVSTSGVTDFN